MDKPKKKLMEQTRFGKTLIVTNEHGITKRGVWVQAIDQGYLDRKDMEGLAFYLTSLLEDWEREDEKTQEENHVAEKNV